MPGAVPSKGFDLTPRTQEEWDRISLRLQAENLRVRVMDAELHRRMEQGYNPSCPSFPCLPGSYAHQDMMEAWWGE